MLLFWGRRRLLEGRNIEDVELAIKVLKDRRRKGLAGNAVRRGITRRSRISKFDLDRL